MKNIRNVVDGKMASEFIEKSIMSDGGYLFIYTGKMTKYIFETFGVPHNLFRNKLYTKITSSLPQNIYRNYNFNDK